MIDKGVVHSVSVEAAQQPQGPRRRRVLLGDRITTPTAPRILVYITKFCGFGQPNAAAAVSAQVGPDCGGWHGALLTSRRLRLRPRVLGFGIQPRPAGWFALSGESKSSDPPPLPLPSSTRVAYRDTQVTLVTPALRPREASARCLIVSCSLSSTFWNPALVGPDQPRCQQFVFPRPFSARHSLLRRVGAPSSCRTYLWQRSHNPVLLLNTTSMRRCRTLATSSLPASGPTRTAHLPNITRPAATGR